MNINNLKELEERKTLEMNDTVYFTVGEETIEYVVRGVYLLNSSSDNFNNRIFEILERDKEKIAEKAYGYPPTNLSGNTSNLWPQTKDDDYSALTRLVKELYKIIEEKKEVYIPILTRWELLDL